jgi:Ran GTPase-activating protein (RanGAP) involved in mRNA processing and transport
VNELKLGCSGRSLAVSLAVESLLEFTTTLQKFELSLTNVEADAFHPIARSLIKSKSVTDVEFGDCYFNAQNDMLMLKGILESKANLQALTLHQCSVGWSENELGAAIISRLQPHSLLRSLDLYHYLFLHNYGFATAQEFNGLLAAIERSPLERFSIGTIRQERSV